MLRPEGGANRGVGGKKVLPRFMGGQGERGVWGDAQAAPLTGRMQNGREGRGCWGAGMRGRGADEREGDEELSVHVPRTVTFDTGRSKGCSSGRYIVFTIK